MIVKIVGYNNAHRAVEFQLVAENDGEKALLGAMATNRATFASALDNGDKLRFYCKVN